MIEINNLTEFKIDKKSFSQVAKKILLGENRQTGKISLAFVNKSEIQKLNKKYRKKNKPTDVLSFGNPTSYKIQVTSSESGYLGEVVICPEVVKENAKKHKSDFQEELLKVFIHGVLHLLGYEHEKSAKRAKQMQSKEEQ